MEYETMGDEKIPKIGLGTWRMENATCREAVSTALDLGYRHIDTAQAYGNERQVGQAIENADVNRDEVFLTTKVWPMNRKRADIVNSVHESLTKLGTEYVDLLLIHWPNPLASTGEVVRTLSDLQNDELARHIGVSNFDVEQLETAREEATVDVFTDQVQFHPYNPQEDLLDYCQANDVLLTAYSPLAHGGAMHDHVLTELGNKYDKTPAQVALRWVTQQENVVTIPKSTSEEHLKQNLEVFDFELTETEMAIVARPSRLQTGISMVRGRLGR